jgi:hypothetical protein
MKTRAESERIALTDPRIREARFRVLLFFIGEHFNGSPGVLLPVPCYFLMVNCAQPRRIKRRSHSSFDLEDPPAASIIAPTLRILR